jgi:hypothetical protein
VLLKAVRSLERLPLSLLQAGDYLEILEEEEEEEEDCLEVLQPNPRLVDLQGLEHLEARQAHSQHSQRLLAQHSRDLVLLKPANPHRREDSLRRPHNQRQQEV